jgi:CHASE3 domain sensor protein
MSGFRGSREVRQLACMRGGLTRRMVIASALLALLIGGGFAIQLVASKDVGESFQLARHSRQELLRVDRLESLVLDLETGQRGFAITRQEGFLQPWKAARAAFPEQLGSLVRFADSPGSSRT